MSSLLSRTSSFSTIDRSTQPSLPLSEILAKDSKDDLYNFIRYNSECIKKFNEESNPLLIQLVVAKAYNCAAAFLEKKDCDLVDRRDQNGLSALHHACANATGENRALFDLIKKLLQKGASPYARNQEGYTPLHIAVFLENDELVKLLCLHCVSNGDQLENPNTTIFIPRTRTLLHEAAERSDKCLHFVLQLTDNLDIKDDQGRTPLHCAVLGKYADRNTFILCSGYSVEKDIIDKNYETPLGIACREGKETVASTLLAHGADANVGIVPPLLYAYLNDFSDIFLLLLVKGANQDEKWGKNYLLEVAYARNEHKKVDLLLQRKAKKTAAYNVMESLKEKAEVSFFSAFIPDKVGQFSAKELKAKEHLKVIFNNEEKNTHLHELVLRGDIDFKTLLAYTKGKDWEVTNARGLTPFLYCCLKGPLQNIACLLCSDAKQNAQDALGNTALHLALESEYPAVFYFLAWQLKAIINTPNSKGHTVLYKAVERKDKMAVDILLKHGADARCTDKSKNGLLHLICSQAAESYKLFEPIITLLSKKNLHYDAINEEGDTATSLAWQKGNKIALYRLLDLGASPDIIDSENQTLLIQACRVADYVTAERLVMAGADRNKKVRISQQETTTALIKACEVGDLKLVTLLLDKKICASKGKEKVAHPNRGTESQTPLTCVIDAISQSAPSIEVSKLSQFQILDQILKAGADPNKSVVREKSKITPLALAINRKLLAVIQKLLQFKAKINKGNPSPLVRACNVKSAEIAKLLLQHKAKASKSLKNDPTFQDAAGIRTDKSKELSRQSSTTQLAIEYVEDDATEEPATEESSAAGSTYTSKQSSPSSSPTRRKAELLSAEEIIKRLQMLHMSSQA